MQNNSEPQFAAPSDADIVSQITQQAQVDNGVKPGAPVPPSVGKPSHAEVRMTRQIIEVKQAVIQLSDKIDAVTPEPSPLVWPIVWTVVLLLVMLVISEAIKAAVSVVKTVLGWFKRQRDGNRGNQ